MSWKTCVLGLAIVIATGCAKGGEAASGGGDGGGSGGSADASCGNLCDQDGDGVPDGSDQCPNTPAGAMVNDVGCAASQLMPKLEPTFPPYGLAWSSGGDMGRAGGLTWTYTGIERKDLFQIDWVICDDPANPCGLSLDGAIDSTEAWMFDATDSMLATGTLVFTNATHIALADGTSPALVGRLTLTIVDGNMVAIPFATVATLGITTPRLAQYGAAIPGTGFVVTAIAEVQDTTAPTFTPYLDYYDAAHTPEAGGGANGSFGGSFYDK